MGLRRNRLQGWAVTERSIALGNELRSIVAWSGVRITENRVSVERRRCGGTLAGSLNGPQAAADSKSIDGQQMRSSGRQVSRQALGAWGPF